MPQMPQKNTQKKTQKNTRPMNRKETSMKKTNHHLSSAYRASIEVRLIRSGATLEEAMEAVHVKSPSTIHSDLESHYIRTGGKDSPHYKAILTMARKNKAARGNKKKTTVVVAPAPIAVVESIASEENNMIVVTAEEPVPEVTEVTEVTESQDVVHIVETGFILEDFGKFLEVTTAENEVVMPAFCEGELQKLARSNPVANRYFVENNENVVLVFSKDEPLNHDPGCYPKRVRGIVGLAVELWLLGFKPVIHTNSRQVEELVEAQKIVDITVRR